MIADTYVPHHAHPTYPKSPTLPVHDPYVIFHANDSEKKQTGGYNKHHKSGSMARPLTNHFTN